MNIKINENWKIGSDALNVTLYERKQVKKPKAEAKEQSAVGKEYWVEQGNYGTIEQALEGFYKRNIRRSEAKSFEELLEEIKSIHKTIKEIAKEIINE